MGTKLKIVLTLSLLLGASISCSGPNIRDDKPISFPVLTHGEPIDLSQHISKGQYTVFDVFADWCPPCKVLDLSLVDLKRTYGSRLAILKLDIVSFESALAVDLQVKDLPYLIIYNEAGELLHQGPSNQVLPQLIRALNE